MSTGAPHQFGLALSATALALCVLAAGCSAPDYVIQSTGSENSIIATDFPSGTVTTAGHLVHGAEDQGGSVLSDAGGDGWSGALYTSMDRPGLYRFWDMTVPVGSSVQWPNGTTSTVRADFPPGDFGRIGQVGTSVDVTVTGVAAPDGVTFEASECQIGSASTAPLSADIDVVDLSGPASLTFDVSGSLGPFDSPQPRRAARTLLSISPFDVESPDGSMPQVVQFVVLDGKTAVLRNGTTLVGGLAALSPLEGVVQVRARVEVRHGSPYAVELDFVE